jgi:hypothetical protein
MFLRRILLLTLCAILLAACGGVRLPSARAPQPPTDAQLIRLNALDLPASIGRVDAAIVFAVPILPVVLETDGTATGLTDRQIAAARTMLEDAALRIPEWSQGRYTVRFELRVIDMPVPLSLDGEAHRWPDPERLDPLVARAFPSGADAVLVMAPPTRATLTPAALTAPRRFFTTLLPYLFIPARVSSSVERYPGEIIVHEFGHALELWSVSAGAERPSLHQPLRYGFVADKEHSYKDWYRFFFSHETVALADAAGRISLLPFSNLWPARFAD